MKVDGQVAAKDKVETLVCGEGKVEGVRNNECAHRAQFGPDADRIGCRVEVGVGFQPVSGDVACTLKGVASGVCSADGILAPIDSQYPRARKQAQIGQEHGDGIGLLAVRTGNTQDVKTPASRVQRWQASCQIAEDVLVTEEPGHANEQR